MNFYQFLLCILGANLFVSQLYSMQMPSDYRDDYSDYQEYYEDTPPPVPVRTTSLPPKPERPRIIPSVTTPLPTYYPQAPSFQENAAYQSPTATPAPSLAQLTQEESYSIQKIEADLNKILLNLIDIAQHGVKIGIAAASTKGDQIVSSTVTEGGPILLDVGKTTLLIANIIKHCRRLSKASPEAQAVAQERILDLILAPNFQNTVERFEQYAASSSAPRVLRSGLQKLAQKLKNLPVDIVHAIVSK